LKKKKKAVAKKKKTHKQDTRSKTIQKKNVNLPQARESHTKRQEEDTHELKGGKKKISKTGRKKGEKVRGIGFFWLKTLCRSHRKPEEKTNYEKRAKKRVSRPWRKKGVNGKGRRVKTEHTPRRGPSPPKWEIKKKSKTVKKPRRP